MEKRIVQHIQIIFLLLLCTCSSSLISYKDKSYYSIQNKEKCKIFICPISSIKFDDTSKSYVQYFLKQPPNAIEDTVLKYFNFQYNEIAKKHIKKKKALICDLKNITEISSIDTSQIEKYVISNKQNNSFLEIKFRLC